MATKKDWKTLLQEIKKYLDLGRKHLFQAVKKSVELYENREFREEYELYDDKAIEKWFTKNLFSDYGLDFLELRAVYKKYGSENDWKEKTVSEMYDSVLDDVEKLIRNDRKTKSWKTEALELEKKLKEANEEIKNSQSSIKNKDDYIEELKSEITELRKEVEELKIKCAKLEGRLEVSTSY